MYQDPVMSYPIAQGVKLLDENMPGWYRESSDPHMKTVNLDTLAIDSPWDCILGQLFGFFGTGLERLGLDFHDAERLGFTVPDQTNIRDYSRIYEAYTREWTDVIAARRAAGV